MKFSSYVHLKKVFQVCSNQGYIFPLNYANGLLGSYVSCILFTMYYYMSPCNIPFLTYALKPMHRFAPNFVWMFLGRTPTKFVKIRVLLNHIFHGIMDE